MKNLSVIIIAFAACLCSCKFPGQFDPRFQPFGRAVLGLEIILPAGSILEQETARAEALVILSDGKKQAADVSWEALDTNIAAVDQSGYVTGIAPGNARIGAFLGEMSAMAEIEVRRRIDYSRIMISEVFYDAEGSDDGREFIELYNDNDYPCDIGGMAVIDGSSSSKAFVLPAGSMINAKSCAVIAQSRDAFFALFGIYPDFGDFTFSLNNTGETVFLLRPDGAVADAVYIEGGTEEFRPDVAWGPAGLPAAPAGSSVYRTGPLDTGTNADWMAGPPSPARL
jgi:hypothetical protein